MCLIPSHDSLELNILLIVIFVTLLTNKKYTKTKMEDLISPQIKESCKLALPDGLQELMSDITREVLRYQPRDLYKFIADYLSAMLITRDNLSIAACICNDVAHCSCAPELYDELRDIGLSEDDIKTAADVIVNYFEKDKDEGNLLMKLMKNTNIHEDVSPAVQDAIRHAYLRHQALNTTKYESSSNSEQDDMMNAAKHTLDLYKKTAPSKEMYNIMAEKIQKSYRAYGVRREAVSKNKPTKMADKFVTLVDPMLEPETSNSNGIALPKPTYSEESLSMKSSVEDADLQISSNIHKRRITTVSSTSLAGSFVTLPQQKPYSVQDSDFLSNLEEFPEREHAHIDYTADNPHVSIVTDDKLFFKKDKNGLNEEAKRSLDIVADDDSVSRDSNVTSMMGADSDVSYLGDVMRIESNYDGDTELSDIIAELPVNKT